MMEHVMWGADLIINWLLNSSLLVTPSHTGQIWSLVESCCIQCEFKAVRPFIEDYKDHSAIQWIQWSRVVYLATQWISMDQTPNTTPCSVWGALGKLDRLTKSATGKYNLPHSLHVGEINLPNTDAGLSLCWYDATVHVRSGVSARNNFNMFKRGVDSETCSCGDLELHLRVQQKAKKCCWNSCKDPLRNFQCVDRFVQHPRKTLLRNCLWELRILELYVDAMDVLKALLLHKVILIHLQKYLYHIM